jgi:hypothetical protein
LDWSQKINESTFSSSRRSDYVLPMSELLDKWKTERAEMQKMLESLQSGKVRIGNPWEGRAEAKIAELRHKIGNLDQLIETENARRP